MKNKIIISVLNIFLMVGFISCNVGTEELPIPLEKPIILSPQEGAVCYGEITKQGYCNIKVEAEEVKGTKQFIFSLWDSQGNIVDEQINNSNLVTFINVEAGKAYVVNVKVKNDKFDNESDKISFSTPGKVVSNYIPVIKSFNYDEEKSIVSFILHDNDKSDNQLYYRLEIAKDVSFKNPTIVKENNTAKIDTKITVNLGNSFSGQYIRVIVKDNNNNQSSMKLKIKRNQVPTTPLLLTPKNNSIVGIPLTLNWNKSTDIDNDDIKYTIYLSKTNSSELIPIKTNCTETSYVLNNLQPGVYKWLIESNDGKVSVKSEEFSFTIKKDNILNISSNNITLKENETQTVTITAGSGTYTASSDNTDIATVSINGNNIKINGLTEGSATITITDTKTNQTKDIIVTVEQITIMSFEDNFDDNNFNNEFWHKWVDGTGADIKEENGVMKIEQNKTDKRTTLKSKNCPFKNVVTFERDVFLHSKLYQHHWYYGNVFLKTNDEKVFVIRYNKTKYYDGGYHDKLLDGIYLEYNKKRIFLHSSIFDKWFKEKVEINKNTKNIKYYINNKLIYNGDLNIDFSNSKNFTLHFNSYGWWTGHKQYMDNFKIKY